jgi:hypothetical protein
MLQKEIITEEKERGAVESSLERGLLDALHEYSKVLELSSEPDLEIVFQVINLWLTNTVYIVSRCCCVSMISYHDIIHTMCISINCIFIILQHYDICV